MTTEEKLDRLIERHEALTESTELLQAELGTLKESVQMLVQSAQALLDIARSHETRIARLEDGPERGLRQ